MNTTISNHQQFIYMLQIKFEDLFILKENYIELSLLPISFLTNNTITKEVILKKEQMKQMSSGNGTDGTTFLFIDIQTGLCWDIYLHPYTCWLKALTESINNELCYYGMEMKVSNNESRKAGLFSIINFSTYLTSELIE